MQPHDVVMVWVDILNLVTHGKVGTFFFFLICNKTLSMQIKDPSILGRQINQARNEQESKNWCKDTQETESLADTQSNKVLKNNNFNPTIVHLESSKLCPFRSRQRHHIRQCGTAFQTLMFRCLPRDSKSLRSSVLAPSLPPQMCIFILEAKCFILIVFLILLTFVLNKKKKKFCWLLSF